MYELVQAGKNSYYIQSPAKVGIVKLNDTDVCLIDSGSDKDGGRRVRQILDREGWRLTAIYNTHSHADHIGGNKYLQTNTGCKVFAPGLDWAITNMPILEPAFLYGGFSPEGIRHKFIMAQESKADLLTEESLPEGMKLIPLKGHSFDMVGFRTSDDVAYIADCVCSRETIEKYQISFTYDVASHLETLERVKKMEAALFVPAHADATDNIAPLAQLNIQKTHEIAEKILQLCAEPATFEEVLQKLFIYYNMKMNFDQYVLVGSTVRSYMAWLKNTDRLDIEFEDNKMLWRKI